MYCREKKPLRFAKAAHVSGTGQIFSSMSIGMTQFSLGSYRSEEFRGGSARAPEGMTAH